MVDSDNAERGPCKRCGAPATGGTLSAALCPACLFALALREADETSDGGVAATCKVLTVLAGDETSTTYLAGQGATGRLVTLEVVRAGAFAGLTPASFDARMKMLARLTHPAIAPVLDGRLTGAGDYCVTAQYVPGPAIDCYCRRHRPGPVERFGLFSEVCRAIEHAHAQGVVHGRLTPQCVVVRRGANGVRPVVTGFSACNESATFADDVAALERLLQAVAGEQVRGGPGLGAVVSGASVSSVAALREAVDRQSSGPSLPSDEEAAATGCGGGDQAPSTRNR